jgi:hypothetical protein
MSDDPKSEVEVELTAEEVIARAREEAELAAVRGYDSRLSLEAAARGEG